MAGAYGSLGTGSVYTPTNVRVIHFGSPIGASYGTDEEEDVD